MTTINLSSHNGNWLSLLSATFACFIIVTGEFLAISVLNDIAHDFQISTGTAGLTVTVTSIAGMVSALFVPIYAKNIDRRQVLLFLVALMIFANAITAFASSFGLVLLGRFALGIALGGFWGVAAGLVIRLAPKNMAITTSVTIFFSAVTLVTVIGVPLGALLSDNYGWRMPYIALVIAGIAALLMQYFSLPSLKPSSSMQWNELLLMPSHPIARKGLIIFTLIFLAHFSAYNYFTVFFKQTAGFAEGQISALLLFFGLASVVGNILAGYVGKYNVRYNFAISALLLALAFLALSALDFNWATSVIFVFSWGVAAGMVPATINMWMHVHVPELTEKGSALITFMFLILITIGSLVGGYVMDHFNGGVLMASMLTIATLAFLLVFTFARGLTNCARFCTNK
ncbi:MULTISPECIES: MFS transporter [Providencia]|uniref:MFS transporter n=1 Tax=Providencia TaxID=586 RepID=UPI001980E66B|nr:MULTISPECIES: MFS transporter [Providencia]HEC8327312.1 MFS transporter [Providencia rettgeri]MBN4865033.1 MFS transporter [Providencia stuartii]MBN4874742.1 MFS transporter [Providencia stuartii]MBN4879045.1 MFS transporter [Providencia stuartii]MBN4883942.1 MFS transporter [Providencia stuartii]